MGEKTALIFGAMDQGDWSFLAPLRGASVFCADGGLRCARAAGFEPDYYIGDGDSGGSPPSGVPAEVLPVRKDLTDLQAAWEQAYALGGIFQPSRRVQPGSQPKSQVFAG